MKFAGPQANKFCSKPDSKIWACLLFGSDGGVISDQVLTLCTSLSAKHSDPEIIRLSDDEIRKEPALLFDALEAVSLLGYERIIRVQTTGEKIAKLLLEAIAMGEADPDRFAAKLIISAGPLAKRSKLRSTIEAARHAAALHFFDDETADIAELARNKLRADKVEIEDEALAMFAADLPGHRGLANAEIEKLTLFGIGLGRPVSSTDIRALATTDADHGLHDLVDATLSGNPGGALATLDKLAIVGTSPISILRALQREAMRMLAAHNLAGSGGEVGMKLKPPVFKNAWPAFRAKLSLWSPKRLARLIERIYDAEEASRTAGGLGLPVVRKLVADLSNVAAKAKT
ncbi:MAG: DNA polymerase III subunit delta [Hyphomonadaceae bacterium]